MDQKQPEGATAFHSFEDLSFGVLIQILGRLAFQELEALSQCHGMSAGHLSLLGMVRRYPGQQLRFYGQILKLPEATLSRYATKLSQQALVESRADASDARCKLLFITVAGEQMVETILSDLRVVNLRFEEAVGKEELEALRGKIGEFLDRMAEQDAC